MLRCFFCTGSPWYELQKALRLKANYLKKSLKSIFEMASGKIIFFRPFFL
jgi:hypothetical protein